jgi:hypothetical protein
MAGVSEKGLIPVGPFSAGVDNLNEETNLTRSDDGKRIVALREGVNIDLPRSGWPRRRGGCTLEISGTRMHSLWSGGRFPYMLYADGANLFARNTGGTLFVVRSGLAPREISYAIPHDRVYASNGTQAWCVLPDGSSVPWGVESPAGQPQCDPSSDGGLDAGTYQVAITYLDAYGEESGTGQAVTITIPNDATGLATGGIALSHIPQPIDGSVLRIRVYVTPTNGDVLYQARDLPVGQSSAVIGTGNRGRPLATQFMAPMPAGQIVRTLGGRLYVASGNRQTWSEALRYGLTNPGKNTRQVGEYIALMEAVGEGGDSPGLFVSDHKRTYWIGGTNPATQTQHIAYPYGAVRGTGIVVPASMFGLDTTLPVAYWLANNGVACLGLPGGTVVPLREKQVVAPNASSGASLFREKNGIRQIITSLQGASAQGLAVSDRTSARVYRNGIEV